MKFIILPSKQVVNVQTINGSKKKLLKKQTNKKQQKKTKSKQKPKDKHQVIKMVY